MSGRRLGWLGLGSVLLTAGAPLPSLDLSHPFGARSPWRLTVKRGPDDSGADTPSGGDEPGRLRLCLTRDGGRTCLPALVHPLHVPGGAADDFDEAHTLEEARIVRPAPSVPLLLLRLGSVHSGDNDQRVGTFAFGYDPAHDTPRLAYRYTVTRNRNDEIRYIEHGPLAGAIISAEPTPDAPFGYWIIVNRLAGATYRPVLRYRSATHYGDGNPLAVIDSEMPNIERRLGLWRSGQPLPLPARACAQPHLIATELWCGPPVAYR